MTTASKAPAPTMCTEAGCTEPAVFTYVWPWGEQGACCSTHRTHVQQKSDQLDRGQVNFVALDPNYRPPLSRDERTQLIAAKMSAEQEAQDAKARGGEIYAENLRLADEVRRLRALNTELEAQVKDRKADIADLKNKLGGALAALDDANAELRRVKPLIGKPSAPPPAG